MKSIDQVLESYGGVVRAKHLRASLISDSALKAELSSGRVIKVARGVYARPDAPPTLLAIRSLPAEPACVTAAQQRGLWILNDPPEPHVAANHGRPYPGFVHHRCAVAPTTLDAVVQVLHCLPELDALVIAESAVVMGVVSMPALRERLRGQAHASARMLVSQIVPHSQSILECMARYWLRKAGFHVESQVHIPGMGHIDLMVDGVLGIESDGAAFHMDAKSFAEDRRRWNVTTRKGIPTLVVGYWLIKDRPEEFIQMVHEAMSMLRRSA